MKQFAFLVLLLTSYVSAKSQFLEFGGGVGALTYAGDLGRGYDITQAKPGFLLFHRMNLSSFFSVRWGFTAGFLRGSDKNPIDPFAEARDFEFDLTILEASSTLEYHFLDYKQDKSFIKWSPYAFAGIGFTKLNNVGEVGVDFNRIQPVLPFGLGFKHLIGKQFSAGLEIGVRKTFFDHLDKVPEADLMSKDFQSGNSADDDIYYFVGISVSYILYKIPCPFPYIPNRSILRR
ncbi:MAG: outer membrane beta-barrel protein [Cyclobacteriaceae bacterium]|nr:outer membrane beta-barrel protein [Cyclobacteriaceae bacterium HetDA_MAG_MS6]